MTTEIEEARNALERTSTNVGENKLNSDSTALPRATRATCPMIPKKWINSTRWKHKKNWLHPKLIGNFILGICHLTLHQISLCRCSIPLSKRWRLTAKLREILLLVLGSVRMGLVTTPSFSSELHSRELQASLLTAHLSTDTYLYPNLATEAW
jgi:hypothetical protein